MNLYTFMKRAFLPILDIFIFLILFVNLNMSKAGSRGEKVFQGAILTVRYFFDALNVEYAGELIFRGIDGKGAIRQHPSAIKEAFEAGRQLVAG
jgi:hypothetical protein